MAKLSALRKSEDKREPVKIGDRAVDNLQFIRETMERSTSFTAVPGYGGILMGATALAAAYIASTQPIQASLMTWLVEAALAFAIGLLAMWQKGKIAGQSLVSAPARKFAMAFSPPLLLGVVITLGLVLNGHYLMLAPVAMLCYGAAIICGGAYSVRIVPVMGWFFFAFGAATFLVPPAWSNTMMAVSFGALHIVFGAIIGRKYGG